MAKKKPCQTEASKMFGEPPSKPKYKRVKKGERKIYRRRTKGVK